MLNKHKHDNYQFHRHHAEGSRSGNIPDMPQSCPGLKVDKKLGLLLLITIWAVGPHSFFADPDPAVFLNADQLLAQCGSGPSLKTL